MPKAPTKKTPRKKHDVRDDIAKRFERIDDCSSEVVDSTMSLAVSIAWTLRARGFEAIMSLQERGVAVMSTLSGKDLPPATLALFVGPVDRKVLTSIGKMHWFPGEQSGLTEQHKVIMNQVLEHAHGIWSSLIKGVATVAGVAAEPGQLAVCQELSESIGEVGRKALIRMLENKSTMH